MAAALLFVRAYWKAGLFAVLALLLAIQTVRLGHERNLLEKERINSNELRAELRAISDAKNRQKAETEKRIEQADKGNRDADRVAREIEEAPLVGDCRTPDVILKGDI